MESEAVRRLMMALEDAGLQPMLLEEDVIVIHYPPAQRAEVIVKELDDR